MDYKTGKLKDITELIKYDPMNISKEEKKLNYIFLLKNYAAA
jgi:hypothetical protein